MLVFLVSCSTTQTVQYKTLASVATTVDSALAAYWDLRVAGKVNDTTHAKVVEIKLKYEKAFTTAVSFAQANLSSSAPEEVMALAGSLVSTIKAIK